jgi:ribosome-binding protein aMBF1 (putative translation factor)
MNWEITYYSDEVQETIGAWPVGIRAYYARLTERMCVFGPNLDMPFTRSMGQGLFEIRARGKEGIGRADTWPAYRDGEMVSAMKTHDEMIREWTQDPASVREYDELEQEFALFDELLRARKEAGMTQAEVAERMATQPSVVARLEAGGGRQKHSPSIATLQKYAEAVGCHLEIKLVRASSRSTPKRRTTSAG